MKKVLFAVIITLFTLLCVNATVNVEDESYYAKFRGQDITLNVYNWGE